MCIEMEEVAAVLERLGLGKYVEAFEDEGFDDIVWMCTCKKEMLVEITYECNLAPDDAVKFVEGMLLLKERTNRACMQLSKDGSSSEPKVDKAAPSGVAGVQTLREVDVPSEAEAKEVVLSLMREVIATGSSPARSSSVVSSCCARKGSVRSTSRCRPSAP